ncbi:MAG: PQQ-binding-like beta-propeller repeat protein [Pirellulaceae bacterium]|nr:PQQ-binding-like beta-propeller repeat protein [Pirellulaceae bacterium]
MNQCRTRILLFAAMLCLAWLLVAARASSALGGDWPMYRYDAGRGNWCPDELPDGLRLAWERELPAPRPAWPASQFKLQFDGVPQPIVAGRMLITGSSVHDSVTAYDTRTGREVWRFYTSGPVRFALAAWEQKVYAASDDGYLYCLDAASGDLRWKVRGGPGDGLVLGNERLVSAWPIRGGPVVADRRVYFTAGIWPFMGIFVHSVDAETGQTVWLNSQLGSDWITHPHGAPSFGSIVPQGYLAASGDHLIVPGGRSLPAVLDRERGQLRHFDFGGKGAGGWDVAARGAFYAVGGQAFELATGLPLGSCTAEVLGDRWIVDNGQVQWLQPELNRKQTTDRKGNPAIKVELVRSRTLPVPLDKLRILAAAGNDLLAGGAGLVARFRVSQLAEPAESPSAPPQVQRVWSAEITGEAAAMVAADDRLFVVTRDSRLLCFSQDAGEPVSWQLEEPRPAGAQATDAEAARPPLAGAIRRQLTTTPGYAVLLGLESSELADQLLAASQLQVIAVEADAGRVEQARRRWEAAGQYGSRIAVRQGTLETCELPPYLASLIVAEPAVLPRQDLVAWCARLFTALRPYGGLACLPLSERQHAELAAAVRGFSAGGASNSDDRFAGGQLERDGDWTWLRRPGPLPGSSSWTHQYGDAANSLVSRDELVRAPLGVLWFGGPANDRILPRHGHGPAPQVAGGRLVIEGADMLRCVDVYTGRVLWERELPGLGAYYDTTAHFAGAGEIGSNYVTLPDAVYVVYGDRILELHAASGQPRRQFTLADGGRMEELNEDFQLPAPTASPSAPAWGFLAVDDRWLLATSGPVKVDAEAEGALAAALSPGRYASSSRRLVLFDRHTGQRMWSRTAEQSFRHNAIVLASGKVFCLDSLSRSQLDMLRRRGIEPTRKPRLLALDAASGKELWATDEDVFGTFLNYSADHDVLLQAGSAYRDRARDEADTGMVAYRGQDGQVLWKDLARKHGGPCLLWKDKIITNGGGGYQLELLTGNETGWKYERMYGCNTAIGGQHLLTFRSGAAGFCDLAGDSGTGNIGGFRSGCTSNLVIADGVLSAPDYTRTCTCAYQNQCSLALVPMPQAESWTFSSRKTLPDRYAVNLGAPGDRRAADGVLWYEYPVTGGNSPDLSLRLLPEKVRGVRHHSSRLPDDSSAPAFITSSAVTGLVELRQELPAARPSGPVTVRLYFAELEGKGPGERVFDVAIQGQSVLQGLDVARETGGAMRPLVKEFRDLKCERELVITLRAQRGEPILCGVAVE